MRRYDERLNFNSPNYLIAKGHIGNDFLYPTAIEIDTSGMN